MSALARAFQSARLPAVTETWADDRLLETVRAAVAEARLQPFDLANRGKYRHAAVDLDDEPRKVLEDWASEVVGRSLAAVDAVAVALGQSDYSLTRDDAVWLTRTHASHEMTLDLSASSSGEAEVVYTHRGLAFFTVPQRPRQWALVARAPTVERYDRYLTHRVGDLVVTRLRVALR
jgi:hypothetical protein